MIFLILLLCLFLAPPIFASPQISILSFPQSVVVGDTFPITFNVSSIDIGMTYHYKAVGDSNTDISIFPSCASKYDDCLNIVIADPATNSATATLKINVASLLNNIKIRLAQSDVHSKTYDSDYISITSILSTLTPTSIATPTAVIIPTALPTIYITPTPEITLIPTSVPTVIPIATPTASASGVLKNYLVINEIMANPDTGQDEWIEVKNSSASAILVDTLCFYDALNHSRCLPENTTIAADSYYSHSFTSGFLNNDGDTIHFLDTVITYPNSPKNLSYSLQTDQTWCFANPSQNLFNNSCPSPTPTSTPTSSTDNNSSPALDLQSTLSPVYPGQKFSLTFRLNSHENYSLRLNSPFGNLYSTFTDYHDSYAWLTMSLTVPKTLALGTYPLIFHLKKGDSSHLIDFQPGNLEVIAAPVKISITKIPFSKGRVLGLSTTAVFSPTPSVYCPETLSNIKTVSPDLVFFSWPFLFAGSILFLSPILFPKLYAA